MRKRIIYVLFILMYSSCFGQKQLNGAFYPVKNDIAFENNLFYFEGNKFKYTLRHCTGFNYGQGTYQIIDKQLILNFEELDSLPIHYVKVIDSTHIASDTAVIFIQILNEQAEGESGINAYYKSSTGEYQGTSTDMDGKCKLSISKTSLPTIIFINSIGYESIEIPIHQSWPEQSTIEAKILSGKRVYYSEEDSLEFSIKRTAFGKFVFTELDEIPITYRRISVKKYRLLDKR